MSRITEPRRVVVCCNSEEGHARPMLAVAAAFVARGWQVRVVTGASIRRDVETIGAEHVEVAVQGDLDNQERPAERLSGLRGLNEGATAVFLTPAPAAWQVLLAELERTPPMPSSPSSRSSVPRASRVSPRSGGRWSSRAG